MSFGTIGRAHQRACLDVQESEVPARQETLEDRRVPQLHTLDEVRDRAAGLWRRDAEQSEYEAAIASLRDASEIVMDEAYLEKPPN